MYEALLWTHIFEGWLKVKNTPIKGLFLSNRHDLASQAIIIDGLEWCELRVDYFIFLSAVWTLILTAPIHCRASITEQVI